MKFEEEPNEEFKTPGQFEVEAKERKEKAEFKEKFLDEGTKDIEKMIEEKERDKNDYKKQIKNGLINKEMGERLIEFCDKMIKSYEDSKARKISLIEWEIDTIKKWGQKERQEHIEIGRKKIEKEYKPRLENGFKETYDHVAKWNIEEIERQIKIIEAIEEGNF